MDAGDVVPGACGGGDLGDDLVEVQRRGVDDARARGRGRDDLLAGTSEPA